jgi:DUF4097 and DUF4098 domain-containing protein YvlB
MDEIMKILELLENGKINAEEAAKLLEAVSRTRPGISGEAAKLLETVSRPGHDRHSVHAEIVDDVMGGVSGIIESIPTIIRQTARLGTRGGKKTLSVKKRPKVKLSMVGGDIDITPAEDDTIKGNLSSGVITARDTKEELWIKCLGGDAEIQLPKIEALAISVVGGDVKGELDSNVLVVKTLEGDISIALKTLTNAAIKSKSGDIDLEVPEDASARIDLYTMSGDIEFEPDIEEEERTDNRLKGKMGEGAGSLTAVNLSGDIKVSKA